MWKWGKSKGPSPELNAIHKLEENMQEQNDLFVESTQEQIGKLARLQYKNAQDIQGKLERLNERLDLLAARQEERTAERMHAERLTTQLQAMACSLVAWIDDIDGLLARLQGNDQEAWRNLLEQWSAQLLRSLAIADIHEMQVLGNSFDPQTCDSVGTSPRKPLSIGIFGEEAGAAPYEIVEVVKRGFVTGDGTILRKAQVITLEVKENHVHE